MCLQKETNIYLAPFQGITTYTYREIYTKYFEGVDKLTTPFYTGNQTHKGLSKRAFELNYPSQNNVEVVPQILSKDANEIIGFANFCEEKGFREINWNLGCPYPRVANKKRGSGMMPYPEIVVNILDQVIPEIRINFSIKCRLGYFSDNEVLKLLDRINYYEISELIVHARLGKQLYSGNTNVDAFKNVIYKSKIPVVYNGDIFSVTDFEILKSKLPDTNVWMIGRGLLVDPFLPSAISGSLTLSLEEQKEISYKFIMDLYLAYRKKTNDGLQSISVLKELWSFMAYSFSEPKKVFNRIKKNQSFDDYEESVSFVFNNYDWVGSEKGLFRSNLL